MFCSPPCRRSRSGSATGNGRPGRPRAEAGWMDDEDSPSCLLCDALFTFTNRCVCRMCYELKSARSKKVHV